MDRMKKYAAKLRSKKANAECDSFEYPVYPNILLFFPSTIRSVLHVYDYPNFRYCVNLIQDSDLREKTCKLKNF
jgi:hypothetical protein